MTKIYAVSFYDKIYFSHVNRIFHRFKLSAKK